jgi:pantoate--beta-alanine ligase
MIVLRDVEGVAAQVAAWQAAGETVALVPTMGNLHAGHLKLVARAKQRAARAITSIFVNPTQFGPNEDYGRYPRTLEADLAKLKTASCDAVFAPDVTVMYPDGPSLGVSVQVAGLRDELCGAFRPGHFDGVATVVAKLFNLVRCNLAFFGEKDFQQLQVIKRMVRALNMPIEIVSVATEREPDGLAMSSRNQYLEPPERAKAGLIYQELKSIAGALAVGSSEFQSLCDGASERLSAQGFVVDYVAIRDAEGLREAMPENAEWVVLIAARLGKTRLIDNLRQARER